MNYPRKGIDELRQAVSLDGVREARGIISNHLPRTPLIRHPLLAETLGCDIFVKHENHLPTGAFKIRGGLNYMAHLPAEKRARGVVTATRGNHGQSVAFAAREFGVRAVVVVPHGNNPEKNAAMRAYGAELIEFGKDFDEARERAEALVEEEGFTYIHSGNEPHLINGVGTYALEIYQNLPDVEVIVTPVGGGSGVCGVITVFRALKPNVELIGVQAENAPANYLSWREGGIVTTESANTFADGLATRVPFELPFSIFNEGLDDMVVVSEEEIRRAIRLLLRTTHNLAEGAGAAAFAAVAKLRARLAGRKVVAVLSGGNIDLTTLRWVLDEKD